jgi:hypothetical protein
VRKIIVFLIIICQWSFVIGDDATAYIKKYRKVAIKEMKKHGIPASITLAQGMLESGNGKSRLARKARNHFGIKCTSDWHGKKIREDDDKKDECFRKYRKAEQSYDDHSKFLKRDRYKSLYDLDKRDYKGWAYGLKKAGYATNPKYPELLIDLIERYDLNKYDKKGAKRKIKQEEKQEQQEVIAVDNESSVGSSQSSHHTVKKGDTLYSISKKYGMNVDELKALNNKTNNEISLGEKLRIKN